MSQEIPRVSANDRFDAQIHFSVPLAAMSESSSSELDRILIPTPEIGRENVGVTRQFLEDADEYHRKYTDTAYFKYLLETAFARCGLVLDSPSILDVGSGSGNSVFPCLEIFEDPHIVATDISPDLLVILQSHLDVIGRARQVVPVCMDATRNLYREESFDLVIGAAILHHLINPEEALVAGVKALKPGGRAIFFEPFEAGNAILRLAYREILSVGAADPREQAAFAVLGALIRDTEVRSGTDKRDEIYSMIDDKWLFTRNYIETLAARLDIRNVDIYPLHGTANPFTEQTRTNLRLAAGLPPESLGSRAWRILGDYDAAFSDELKSDLMIEGGIILTT